MWSVATATAGQAGTGKGGRWHRRKPITLRIRTDEESLRRASRPDNTVVPKFNERRRAEIECQPERISQVGAARGKKVLRLRKQRQPTSIPEQKRNYQSNLERMNQELLHQFQQGVDNGEIKPVGPWSPSPSLVTPKELSAGFVTTPQSSKIYRMNRELMQQFRQGLASGMIKEVGPFSPTSSAGPDSARQRPGSGRLVQTCSRTLLQETRDAILAQRAAASSSAKTDHSHVQIERIPSHVVKVDFCTGSASFRRCSAASFRGCSSASFRRCTSEPQCAPYKTQQSLLARCQATHALTIGIFFGVLAWLACGLGHLFHN